MSVQFAPRYTALIVASLFATAPMAVHAQSTSATTQAATTKQAAATAESSGVVLSDIQVNGLQRSDPTSVFSAIPVKVGQRFNSDKGQEIIKVLFATGLYEDVSLDLNGNVLVITLAERPVISDLSITGMKQFERKQVLSTLKTNGFAQGYAYDPALLERVKTELQAMYAEAGLVNVKIDADVKPEGNKQVSVAIKIEEGKFTKVKRININGNEKLSDRAIRSAMETDKNGIFSWYTKDSRFTPEKLSADLESVRGLYYDRGYMDFDFTRVEAPPSADGKGIDINIDVTEGIQYRVNSINFAGDIKEIPSKDIEKIVKYPKNALYSRMKISEIVNKVSQRFSQEGYALAKVEVQPIPNASTGTIDVTIAIEPQERVYVRRINVIGNSRTKDEVIRREVRQMETAIYNDTNVQLSRDRIDRLGFFSEVLVDVQPVEGTNNQVDVNYKVTEVPTGALKLGLGYSSTDKISLTGSVSENNILGTGNSLGVDVDTSESSRNLTISTSNPYLTKDGISQSASVYYKTFDASKVDVSDVKYTTYGLNLVYGIPVSEKHRVYFGINPESNKIELDRDNSPPSYLEFVDKYKKTRFTTLALTAGWSFDTRDSTFAPSRGIYQRLNLEVAPVGTLKYYKASYQYQQYIPLSKYLTFAFNGQFDYGRGFGSSKGDYPFFKNMYAGGLGSVRGYESGSLGPIDEKGNNLGGSKKLVLNTEIQFPFPGMSKNRGVRLFTFADASGLWSDSFKVDGGCDFSKISVSGCNGLRYSYGVGLSWNSPIGPLKFSYALPINKKDGDKIERFQFQIGTSF
jgi:outer membrane protein insertion porin family